MGFLTTLNQITRWWKLVFDKTSILRNDMILKHKTPDYDTLFFFIITRLCLWMKAIDSNLISLFGFKSIKNSKGTT
jgi:hypothetical protein